MTQYKVVVSGTWSGYLLIPADSMEEAEDAASNLTCDEVSLYDNARHDLHEAHLFMESVKGEGEVPFE